MLRRRSIILPRSSLERIVKAGFFLDFTLVQHMQNFAARIISNNYDYIHFRGIDLVKQLDWQTMADRPNVPLSILMHKCLKGMETTGLANDGREAKFSLGNFNV